MLGIVHQFIYCNVTNCKFNEKGVIRDGKTNKIIEVDYTCNKESIQLDSKGVCTSMVIIHKQRRT